MSADSEKYEIPARRGKAVHVMSDVSAYGPDLVLV